ncbi:YiiD C-terminal domain-containing protein [Ferrimonas gelatinilytica]|uniref:YiiD C-terminal domain-containing protein n=1 Tax=Ferrimonas gelatinilytica TaxID=1255257 RepID=A0ABP9SAP7_9GAMM
MGSCSLRRLTALWHETIPLSRFMGIEAVAFEEGSLLTRADTEANKNLHGTAFAGSLYSLATLTGWGRVWLALEEAGLSGDIVLAEGQIHYRRPVRGLPQSRSLPVQWDLTPLARGEKAVCPVTVAIGEEARFQGRFVVLPRS